MKKSNIINIIIFIIFIISLGYSLFMSAESRLLQGEWYGQDMDQYIDYSNSLLSGNGFSAKKVATMYLIDVTDETGYVSEILRLPGYPFILTLGRLIYDNPILALIYNYIFYILILFYTFKIIRVFTDKWPIIIVFLCVALHPTILFYTTQGGNADILSCFTLTGFLYHTLQINQKQKLVFNTIFGALLGVLGVLSRQNILIFILPFLILLIILNYRRSKKLIKYFIIVSTIILLSLSIWIIRNYRITERFIISAASGSQLFNEHIYFTPYPNKSTELLKQRFLIDKEGYKDIQKGVENNQSVSYAYAQFDKKITKITLTHIIGNPIKTARHYAYGIKSFFTSPTFSLTEKNFFYLLSKIEHYLSYLSMIILILFPIIYFRKLNKYKLLLILWFCSFIFICLSAFFHGIVMGNRGIVPVLPLVIILSTLFIYFLFTGKLIKIKK